MQLGHLLTPSGLTPPEVPSLVFPGSSCLLVCSFLEKKRKDVILNTLYNSLGKTGVHGKHLLQNYH
jgi:hypothetical protein